MSEGSARLGGLAARVGGRAGSGRLRRSIWSLAWPAILTFGLESVVGLVDMLMVGRLGAHAVAGAGIGTQIFSAVSVVMVAGATGTVALIARDVGAGRRAAAERILLQSLYTAALVAAVVAAPVFWWAREIVSLFGIAPGVTVEAEGYVRCIMLGVPSAALFTALSSALRGAGDMRTPLFLGALVNVANVAGNFVLIFGYLGAPALGVRGAALASGLAFTLGVAMGIGLLLRSASLLRLPRRNLALHFRTALRILGIGGPTGIEQLLMQIGFLLYLKIAALYGTSAVAAYVIGVRILALSFLPGFGFGAASSTIVGQRLGAGDPQGAAESGWASNRLAILFMSAGGIAIFLAAERIARLFVDDAAVVADAVSFIRTLAAAQPLMAADFTLGGALRGAGDTRFPLLTVVLGFYGVRLGFALAAARVFSLSLAWVWAALLGDYLVRAVLKAWRFRSGRWKTIRI